MSKVDVGCVDVDLEFASSELEFARKHGLSDKVLVAKLDEAIRAIEGIRQYVAERGERSNGRK